MARSEKPLILILEKEEILRESLCMVLLEEDYRCLAATGKREALRILEERAVDLMILDTSSAGEALFLSVRDLKPSLPILLLSSYDDREFVADAMKAGAAGYLFKPLDFEELFERLPPLIC